MLFKNVGLPVRLFSVFTASLHYSVLDFLHSRPFFFLKKKEKEELLCRTFEILLKFCLVINFHLSVLKAYLYA